MQNFNSMKKGEYVFKTFEEALNFVKKPTHYEQKHKLKIIETRVLDLADDFKILLRKTSDGRTGIILFFKNSKNYDVWKFWMPSKSQFNLLPVVIDIYINVNK